MQVREISAGYDDSEPKKITTKNCPTKSGRWDETEHAQFLEGVKKYGRDWNRVQSCVPTRDIDQVRERAKRFRGILFTQLQESKTTIDLGNVTDKI